MFYAKTRRIAELEARTAMLRHKLDATRGLDPSAVAKHTPNWEAIAKQLAKDRADADRAAKREIDRLQDVAEGWVALASRDLKRSRRLAAAAVRYWAEIGQLRRELKVQRREMVERVGKLEAQLVVLQDANERHYRELQERPVRRSNSQPQAA